MCCCKGVSLYIEAMQLALSDSKVPYSQCGSAIKNTLSCETKLTGVTLYQQSISHGMQSVLVGLKVTSNYGTYCRTKLWLCLILPGLGCRQCSTMPKL